MIQRHKAFGDEYLANGRNGTEAYKKTYPRCKTSHRQNAAALLSRPDMKAYLKEREKSLQLSTGYTVEKCLKEYEEARIAAKREGHHAAMVQAITGKAKLFGMHVTHTIIEDRTTPLSDKDREIFETKAREMNVKLAAG